jgi:sugar phosphate isomerase/epimerase
MASKAAVQTFTIREHTKTAADFAASLKKISDIGYSAVQLSAVGAMNGESPEVSAAEARKMLDDNGLACIATHRGWDALRDATDAEIAFHQELGCTYAAIGGLPGDYDRHAGADYSRFLADSAPVIAKLKAAGITFGYHNHAHEFQRVAPGERTLYDIFVEDGGADFTLEVDVYWAQHGGVNPVRLLQRCAGRVPVIHVKDKEVVAPDGPVFAAIGEGNLEWDDILPACVAAGVQWYAVEQDTCRRDPFDCLRSSFEFLNANGV